MLIPLIAFMATAFSVPEVTAVGTTTPTLIKAPQTMESYVREYFEDAPIMVEIARCESQFRQTLESGEVLRGRVNNLDVGIMQINLAYHEVEAKKLKYDLMSLEGNLAYASYLYKKQGTAPWVHSSPCWKRAIKA